MTLYRAGRFEETRARAARLVQRWPGLALGWNVLGACLQALQQLDEAAAAHEAALKIEPRDPGAHNNLGNVLRELGRHEEAAARHARAIELKPDLLEAHYNLGLALAALGRHREAAHAFEQVVAMRPDILDAHNHLGNQLKAQGRLAEAEAAYERALALSADHAAVLSNLALVQSALGRPGDAEHSYRRALQARPGAPDILSNLGTLLMSRDRLAEAESCCRAALAARPDSPDLLNNLGVVLHKAGSLAEAKTAFQRAAELDSGSPSTWHNLGNVEMDLGRLAEAERCHRQVLALDPHSATAHRNLGVTLAVLGNRGGAEASYRRALEIDSCPAEVHYRLAEVKTFTANDPDLDRIESQLERDDLAPEERVSLHYAAGKAHADIGADYDTSFRHYRDGAAIQRRLLDYDVADDAARFARIAAAFPAEEVVSRYDCRGHACDVPVFVVGMPRSGTTLVESILASHPAVHGAGERSDIDQLVAGISRRCDSGFPDWVPELAAGEWRESGEIYARRLVETAPEAARIVDKMPNNFQYLGFIAGILPDARIIHVQRNPLDTCLSCFTHLFENQQLFSWDLEELGRFYRAYHDLMTHWRGVLPGDFLLTVRYEEMVRDLEKTARAILVHCGLSWDPACLRPHVSQRAVSTASLVQVRQPIHGGAIDRWKPYEGHLEPLRRALGDLADGLPDEASGGFA